MDRGARLALVEFQRWRDGAGNLLIVPHVPFRTEVVRQRVLVDTEDRPLVFEETEAELEVTREVDPDRLSVRAENRAFWQRFINEVRFDHPDQPPPTHGGNNWVRIPLPPPARWLTAYRLRDGGGGIFLVEDKGSDLIAGLAEQKEQVEAELGVGVRWWQQGNSDAANLDIDLPPGTADQMSWFKVMSNRIVNFLRPLLGAGN